MIRVVLGQVFFPSKKTLKKNKRKQWIIVGFIIGVNIQISVQLPYFLNLHFVIFLNFLSFPQKKRQCTTKFQGVLDF